jgi:L-aminopeptidase/D-esterase-like protein
VAGVDVRGGGPGTRETDLLDPRNSAVPVHAIVLGGGSAYGLAAADGHLVTELRERPSCAGWNGSRPDYPSSIPSAPELREVWYQVKAAARLPEMTSELHASA